MKQRILHLIQDQKFPDSAYELFESVAPGLSRYVLPNLSAPIKYLEKVKPERISRFSFLNPIFLRALERYDIVILHALTEFNRELIARSSSKVNFLWIGLGYDYYDVIFSNKLDLLEPKTREVVMNNVQVSSSKSSISIIRKLFRQLIYKNKTKVELIEKINWFAPVLDNEYESVKESLGDIQNYPKYIDWNYGLTARLIEKPPPKVTDKACNILVGNSASPFNNHFEIFDFLEKCDIPASSKIIIPLSYGNEQYKNIVASEAKRRFGEQFLPVTEFMTFDDYMTLISTCSAVIMNHNRQQGGGNIAAALYVGAKVFLNKRNAFYTHYIDHGAKVFDIAHLVGKTNRIVDRLGQKEAENNREVVRTLRARKVVEEKTRKLIQQLSN